jgi:hypothetical protein
MTRILISLSSLAIILLVTSLVLGLAMGDLYAKPHASSDTLRWATVHRLTGVAAALAVVFVESVIVTYFIGTSRWCREVVETYRLDPSAVRQSNRLKRRTFPWALLGMLTVVGVIALGAAADPGTGRPNTQAWAEWHLAGAVLGIAFIGWTFVLAWNNILANHAIIQGLVAQVSAIRRNRGLERDLSADALSPANAGRPA